MSKKIDEMTDHELLMELVAEKRMRDKIRYVKIGFYSVIFIALIVAGCIYIPKIVRFVNRVNEDIEKIERMVDEMQESMDTMKNYGKDFYNESMAKFTEGMEKLEGTITEIKENMNVFNDYKQNALDSTIDKLSKSVEDLRKMIPFLN